LDKSAGGRGEKEKKEMDPIMARGLLQKKGQGEESNGEKRGGSRERDDR